MRPLVAIAIITSLSFLTSANVYADAQPSKLEILKFRFKKHLAYNFERLVIEFGQKNPGQKLPEIRTVASSNGKEANVIIDKALLIGAIPEAHINESYVAKSKFLGPISINTDGPNSGFTLRTFLKDTVSVDAFWLTSPTRLVVDVFPANSPRVDGRIDEDQKVREIAAARPEPALMAPKEPKPDPNKIACYPMSAAVSAAVSFTNKTGGGLTPTLSLEKLPYSNVGSGPEPVICFLASSQVFANVAFKPKVQESNNYIQWDPNGGSNNYQGRNPMSGPGNGAQFPSMPSLPPMQPAQPMQPRTALPIPSSPLASNGKAPVVSDVVPGRTPLGGALAAPSTVSRVSGFPSPAKLPTQFGDTPTGGAPAKAGVLPPLK